MRRPANTLHRATDPDTSVDAAYSIKPDKMMGELLMAFYTHPHGLTADEAADKCGYTDEDGAWRRVSDLLYCGVIDIVRTPTGRAVTRPGRRGRSQQVKAITPAGIAEVRLWRSEGLL